jgi:hypothetical protein
MAKLDLNSLRQQAIIADEARKTKAAFLRSLRDGIYSAAFECSVDGVVTLTTLAHMSLVSEDFPSEIRLIGEKFKGGSITCRRDADGRWTAHAAGGRSTQHATPWSLIESIAAAAYIPLDDSTRETFSSVVNPVGERDFDHLAKVLDLIPVHSVSAMMSNGPAIAARFDLGPVKTDGVWVEGIRVGSEFISAISHHPDITTFARCVGDAIARRGKKAVGTDAFLRRVISKSVKAAGKAELEAFNDLRLPATTCVEMFDPYVPPEAVEDFLHEAVRVGFDINKAVSHDCYPSTAAHEAVRLLDVNAVRRLEAVGLDLAAADGMRSLTSIVIDRLRRNNQGPMAFAMLIHLVTTRGLSVDAEAYETLDDKVADCKRAIRGGYRDKDTAAELDFFVRVMDFLNKKFPSLRDPKNARRQAA